MQSFVQYTPTEIVFGRGAEDRTAEMVKKHGGSRVMLVYGGGSAVRSGLLDKLEESLKKEGVDCISFGGVQPNPLLSLAYEGIAKARGFNADMIIGVGGGSAIDTAKAIAHGAANPGQDIWEYWLGTKAITKSLPVGVVLTISAAGSETSNSAVITNGETGQKRGLGTDYNRPRFALMNPELTYTLPPYQITCGIVDIMMHTLDRYFTKEDNEFTTEAAEALLRVVIKNGTLALKYSHDYQAMSELMWCGSVSHNGLTGLGNNPDFAVHQLGHELSGMFDVAHGASLSIMWGHWARFVQDERPERFERYANKVWGVGLKEGIEATVDYFKSLNMPTCFSEADFGVQPEDVIKKLAYNCSFKETRKVGLFRPLDLADLEKVYKAANV